MAQTGILDWLGRCSCPLRQVRVTHGEPVPADTIRQLTEERLGFPASAPELGDTIDLD